MVCPLEWLSILCETVLGLWKREVTSLGRARLYIQPLLLQANVSMLYNPNHLPTTTSFWKLKWRTKSPRHISKGSGAGTLMILDATVHPHRRASRLGLESSSPRATWLKGRVRAAKQTHRHDECELPTQGSRRVREKIDTTSDHSFVDCDFTPANITASSPTTAPSPMTTPLHDSIHITRRQNCRTHHSTP